VRRPKCAVELIRSGGAQVGSRERLRFAIGVGVLILGMAAATAASDWPQWRGPNADGVSPDGNPPLRWSEKENVKWKVRIPGEGFSTPIAHRGRIFLLSAIPTGERKEVPPTPRRFSQAKVAPAEVVHQFTVLCLEQSSGKELWRTSAVEAVPNEGRHRSHTFASSSPIAEGDRIHVSFGSHGIFCLDLDGRIVWKRDLGDMETRYSWGEGASPALHGDALIVNWDHEGPSFITALDKRTGKTLWKTARDEVSSWTTPLIVEYGGGAQVVVPATKRIRAYDLKDGREIWNCGGLFINVVSCAVQRNDVVHAMSSYGRSAIMAIRLEGEGDLTESDHRLWTYTRSASYVPSPALHEGRLYFLSRMDGMLTCLDAGTGESFYENRRLTDIRGIYSSPVVAAGRVYIAGRDGATVVVRAGDAFEELAVNRLDDRFDASPAVAGKSLFLRGHRFLYCLEE